jgi:hypothetical protein
MAGKKQFKYQASAEGTLRPSRHRRLLSELLQKLDGLSLDELHRIHRYIQELKEKRG